MLQGSVGNDQMVEVEKKLRDEYVKSIGTYHNKPLHNKDLYEVKYHNSECVHVESNIIS